MPAINVIPIAWWNWFCWPCPEGTNLLQRLIQNPKRCCRTLLLCGVGQTWQDTCRRKRVANSPPVTSLWAMITYMWVLLLSEEESKVCGELVSTLGSEAVLELLIVADGEKPFCLSSPLEKARCSFPFACGSWLAAESWGHRTAGRLLVQRTLWP